MALRTCSKEESARVIAILGEDNATVQISDGLKWTCASRSLRLAELTPLMQLALEAEFDPPTPTQRVKLLEEDITLVAEFENDPAYSARGDNAKKLREKPSGGDRREAREDRPLARGDTERSR